MGKIENSDQRQQRIIKTIDAVLERIFKYYGAAFPEKSRKERSEICKQALSFYLNDPDNHPI